MFWFFSTDFIYSKQEQNQVNPLLTSNGSFSKLGMLYKSHVIGELYYHNWENLELFSGNCKLICNKQNSYQQQLMHVIKKQYFWWEEWVTEGKITRMRIHLQWLHISRSNQYPVTMYTSSPNFNLSTASKIHRLDKFTLLLF